MDIKRIGAFVEYVLRPMSDDIRSVVEELKTLGWPISEALVRETSLLWAKALIQRELVRATSYIIITTCICLASAYVLTHYPG